MMEDVVVLSGSSATRHSCKVCRKGFPCGRSLGGHMRSHSLAEVETALDDDDDEDGEEQQHRRGLDCAMPPGARGYGLREKPKKTRRLSSLSDSGAGGHSDGGEPLSPPCDVREVEELEREPEKEQEDAALIPTQPPSVGLMPPPHRRRRSMRVPAPAAAAPPPAFEKEPEDVALCLIMLSRDILDRQYSTAPRYSKKDKRRREYHHHDEDDSNDASVDIKINKRKPTRSLAGDEKRGRYECPGCGRAFQSYQALGGHRASHKRINSNCSIAKAVVEQPEASIETNTSFSMASPDPNCTVDMGTTNNTTAVVALKAKPHRPIKFECPICFRVFGSGQALGGHKRSHSIAGELCERAHADGDDDTGDVVEQPLLADGFLDLNLPAPGADN